MIAPLCGGSNPPSSTGAADRLVRVADQPAVPGEAGEDREIALGDAEGHVDLAVSPHSATIPPPRSTSPFGPPRGRTGPSASFHGGSSPKSLATISGEIALHGVSCSAAWRPAAARRRHRARRLRAAATPKAGCGGGKSGHRWAPSRRSGLTFRAIGTTS